MTFKIDELVFKDDSEAEQLRVRKIFETLKEKAIKHEFLSEHEKNFFCLAVKISQRPDGVWEDYPCCDNFKFQQLYLIYSKDLQGGSKYYKVNKQKVEPNEVREDLDYLYKKAEDWEEIIHKVNHKDQLLQEISIEARKDLKNLDNLPEFVNGLYSKGSFLYIFKKRTILLYSKFIYCYALEFFEKLTQIDLIFEINGKQIEFNEFSLIHILSRHFAELTKPYNTKKTFHIRDFEPMILIAHLKEVLNKIDASKVLIGKSIDKIGFQLNGIDYLIWTSEREKFIKGTGKVVYRRLETFYPLSDLAEKTKLITTADKIKIDETLSVYIPK